MALQCRSVVQAVYYVVVCNGCGDAAVLWQCYLCSMAIRLLLSEAVCAVAELWLWQLQVAIMLTAVAVWCGRQQQNVVL